MILSNRTKSVTSFASEFLPMQPLVWGLGVVIAVLFYLLNILNITTPFSSNLTLLTLKTKSDLYSLSSRVDLITNNFHENWQLSEQYQQLKEENLALKSKLAETDNIFKENELLVRQSKIQYKGDYNLIGTQIISRDRNAGTVIINKGQEAGVKVGDVIAFENIAVGEVLSVSRYTAEAQLISSPKTKIPVKSSSVNIGILASSADGSYQVEQVLQSTNVNVGENIYTSGIGSIYPEGMLLGTVLAVTSDERAPTKMVKVEPALLINEVTKLVIISKKG
jgi:rod shape-determining protein MreC